MTDTLEKKWKAIAIDAEHRTIDVREMSWDGAREFIGGWLGRGLILTRDHRTAIYIDDDGRVKDSPKPYGFRVDGSPHDMYVGSGVVFSHDEEGDGCDVDEDVLPVLQARVTWLDLSKVTHNRASLAPRVIFTSRTTETQHE